MTTDVPSTVNVKDRFISLLRSEFDRERATDFALLRRIPSTDVRRFLAYFCRLNAAEADALAGALAQSALLTFFPFESNPSQSGNVAYRRYSDALNQMWAWSYQDVRMLKSILAGANADPNSAFAMQMTPDLRKWIESIKPSNSTEIRKVIKRVFSREFPPLKMTHLGGFWRYDGFWQESAISVNIDFHQKYAQLSYGLSHNYQSTELGGFKADLNYERLMGFWGADWDCLELANLDDSIELLAKLIVHCDRFLQLIPDPDDKSFQHRNR